MRGSLIFITIANNPKMSINKAQVHADLNGFYDFLVLGSGVSGLYLSYLLAELGSVLLVTKDELCESNTYYAQGGIASVIRDADSFQSHIADTLKAGAGLCNVEAVEILVKEGPAHIQRLLDMGAPFVRLASGHLDLRREGGHSQERIVHAADFTGRELEQLLIKAVQEKNISILEHHCAVELIAPYHLEDCPEPSLAQPRSWGAYIYSRKSWEISVVQARACILATGGAGQVYLHSTNPAVATGDGIALAYRAGAKIANMEFYQFHPTSLYSQESGQAFLLTEALRGQGAILRDSKGEAFLKRYDPRAELAPRDIVARAIDSELKQSGASHLWLDITHVPRAELKSNFPNVYSHLAEKNIDLSRDWVPTVPAAHYMCGGVLTDLWGRTNVEGLYALGEVACTGVHGGNRLASNSLLESLVFASRIAQKLKEDSTVRSRKQRKVRPWQKEGLHDPEEWIMVQHNLEEIKKIMWNYVGILRSNHRLKRAQKRIQLLCTEIEDYYRRTFVQNKILELRNLALTARLIVDSALMRKESCGLHYNSDCPQDPAPSSKYTILLRSES